MYPLAFEMQLDVKMWVLEWYTCKWLWLLRVSCKAGCPHLHQKIHYFPFQTNVWFGPFETASQVSSLWQGVALKDGGYDWPELGSPPPPPSCTSLAPPSSSVTFLFYQMSRGVFYISTTTKEYYTQQKGVEVTEGIEFQIIT